MKEQLFENYIFDTELIKKEKKNLILIIYDISDNKRRLILAKKLEQYGFRVQRSAFEAMLTKRIYKSMIQDIQHVIKSEDDIRIYRLQGSGEVTCLGSAMKRTEEEVIIKCLDIKTM